MNKASLIRIFTCIFVLSIFLYLYTDQQNSLTKVRIRLPKLAKEIRLIQEENKHLKYEIDQFESPENLMELARRSEFSHLKQPLIKEIINCSEGLALEVQSKESRGITGYRPKPTLAVGARH